MCWVRTRSVVPGEHLGNWEGGRESGREERDGEENMERWVWPVCRRPGRLMSRKRRVDAQQTPSLYFLPSMVFMPKNSLVVSMDSVSLLSLPDSPSLTLSHSLLCTFSSTTPPSPSEIGHRAMWGSIRSLSAGKMND